MPDVRVILRNHGRTPAGQSQSPGLAGQQQVSSLDGQRLHVELVQHNPEQHILHGHEVSQAANAYGLAGGNVGIEANQALARRAGRDLPRQLPHVG